MSILIVCFKNYVKSPQECNRGFYNNIVHTFKPTLPKITVLREKSGEEILFRTYEIKMSLRNYDLEFVEALWKPEVQVYILLISLDL